MSRRHPGGRFRKCCSTDSSDQLSQAIQYQYDVFDRRISKGIDENGDFFVDRYEKYIWDGDGAAPMELATRYLHGPAVDQILAQEDADTGDVLWHLGDNLNTTRDLVEYDPVTGTVSIVEHYTYDAYGNLTGIVDANGDPIAANPKTRYLYTAREWDADAGLYYYCARWYDPAVGRFISEDPIGFAAGDANLVRYVGNAATIYVDPSGLQSPNISYDQFLYQYVRPEVEAILQFFGGGRFDGPDREWVDYGRGGVVGGELNIATLGAMDVEPCPSEASKMGIRLAGDSTPLLSPLNRFIYGANPLDEERSRIAAGVELYLELGGLGLLRRAPHPSANMRQGYTRGYRAVSEAEFQDILKTGRFRQGPNSLEGKWFADTPEGAQAHGNGLYGDCEFRLIEADLPDNAPSLFRQPNLDGRGPARYIDINDLNGVTPRPR